MAGKIVLVFSAALVAWQSSFVSRVMAAPEVDAKSNVAIEAKADEATAANAVVAPTPAIGECCESVFLIVKDSRTGDCATAIQCKEKLSVGGALQGGIYSHPIDSRTASIALHRPRTVVNDDLSVKVEESVFSIAWDVKRCEPTEETNQELQSGDRIVVALPTRQPGSATAIAPVATGQHYAPMPVLATAPPILAATPQPNSDVAKPMVRYSAFPAAVPSPFSIDSADNAIPPVAALPPAAEAPPAVGDRPTPVAYSSPDAWARNGQNVEYAIAVVEDVSGSFTEFPDLKEGLLMVSDNGPTLGAVRIMDKQKLIKRLAAPKIRCAVGEQAELSLGANGGEGREGTTESLDLTVKASGLAHDAEGMHMLVELVARRTDGGLSDEIGISFVVEEGQTAVLKTQPQGRATDEDGHPVYIVLTPKLVK